MQLTEILKNNNFFNPNWSIEDVNKYAEETYNALRKQKLTGKLTYKINGEILEVFIHPNGNFGPVVGQHKLSMKDFK